MTDRYSALDHAARHADRWLDSLRHPPRPGPGLRRGGRRGARHRTPGRPDARRRGDRPARDRLRPRPDRDAVRPVLRVRDRRHAPGRPGRRLAGQRLGPERGAARGQPRARRGRGRDQRLAARPARPAGRPAASASSPAPPCRTSPAWPPPATRCCAGSAGTSPRTACPARRASACWSARSATTPSTWPCATWASARRNRCAADDQGRIDPAALSSALGQIPAGTPAIVVLQAGNLHSGAFDPFAEAIAAAHRHGAWVHIDGAFGLFAAASPATRHLTARLRAGRLVDHRRAQDPQRRLRLRHRDRRRPGRAARRDDDGRARLLHPGRRGRPVRDRPRIVAARPRDPGLGGPARPRPPGRRRPGRRLLRARDRVRRRHRRHRRRPDRERRGLLPGIAPASARTSARRRSPAA